MRGQGRIYQRSERWWIAYYRNGTEFRESAETTNPAEAKRKLKERQREILTNKFIGPQGEKILVNELLDNLISHLKAKEAKSIPAFISGLKPIRETFGFDRAKVVTSQRLKEYVLGMQAAGKKNGTINRGITGFKQAFHLARKEGMLITIPHFPILKEDNARQGFFERHEFEAVVINLPSPINDIARFAFYSGWRKGEIIPLAWNQVDRSAKEIRIPTSKNGHGRVIPLEGELWELIERRWQAREVTQPTGNTFLSPLIFHRKGVPIENFRKSWKAACKKAGYPGKLFHDLRRTACRNFIRAGVPQSVCMALTGHRTIHTFIRYNITSDDDKRQALRATQEHINSAPKEGKVVSLPSLK